MLIASGHPSTRVAPPSSHDDSCLAGNTRGHRVAAEANVGHRAKVIFAGHPLGLTEGLERTAVIVPILPFNAGTEKQDRAISQAAATFNAKGDLEHPLRGIQQCLVLLRWSCGIIAIKDAFVIYYLGCKP